MFLRDAPGRTAMHNEDFCSVALVSHNRHDRLNRLIDSVHQHADMPFELVVSEDAGERFADYNFIQGLKGRVSHLSLNLGWNKGLHVNANNAVSMTRSKYVFLLYDDVEILAPFMRRAVNVLEQAPYMGVMYLGAGLSVPGGPTLRPGDRVGGPGPGVMHCRTPQGTDFGIFCNVGASWATGFRRAYWEEVGGYTEDSEYGDIPFLNKGWERGYFSGMLAGSQVAEDKDKDEHAMSHDSSQLPAKGATNGNCNYPKIFRVDPGTLDGWSRDRSTQCARRQHELRYSTSFSEWTWGDWHKEYMCHAWDGTNINWEVLDRFHSRFLEQVKRDAISGRPEEVK